jgi:hypothetical protein
MRDAGSRARKSSLAAGLAASAAERSRDIRWAYSGVTMSWDLRHRRSSLVIRLLLAVWITVVVVVLCATGRWWGLVFVVPLVLDLYLLRRILAAGCQGRLKSDPVAPFEN